MWPTWLLCFELSSPFPPRRLSLSRFGWPRSQRSASTRQSTRSGMTTREYKRYKGLTKENLRDNMTNMELLLNALAEETATEISKQRDPEGLAENAGIAKEDAVIFLKISIFALLSRNNNCQL